MYGNSLHKIKKEFDEISRNPVAEFGLTVGLVNNDIRKWRFCLCAPKDSLYNNGFYSLTATFPQNYPHEPPIICFSNPIYHCNVNPKSPTSPNDPPLGFINIYDLGFWNEEKTMLEVITQIYSLFYYADINCPYGNEILNEYINNRNVYDEKVKKFTQKYANIYSTLNSPLNYNSYWSFNDI